MVGLPFPTGGGNNSANTIYSLGGINEVNDQGRYRQYEHQTHL